MKECIDPIIYLDQKFQDVEIPGQRLTGGQFFNCIFINCNFRQSDLSGNDYINCKFDGCDLSYAVVRNSGFRDAEFSNCRMMGIDFSECNRFLLSFNCRDCMLDNSMFYGAKIANTTFENCSLIGADFECVDLSSAVFANSNLSDACFVDSNLEHADLRTAWNFKIDPNMNRLKNAIFSKSNLTGLLFRYGLQVQSDLPVSFPK